MNNYMKYYFLYIFLLYPFYLFGQFEYRRDNEYKTISIPMIICESDGLFIREKPSPNSNVLGILPNGKHIIQTRDYVKADIVDGIKNYWYFIHYNEIEGWIFGGNIITGFESEPFFGRWINETDNNDFFEFLIVNRFYYGKKDSEVNFIGSFEYDRDKNELITYIYYYEMHLGNVFMWARTDKTEYKVVFINNDKMLLLSNNKEITLIRDQE